MKRISIGSWAYTIGPYADAPVPFNEVASRLAALGFDGVELGAFPPHPNPDDMPGKAERDQLVEEMRELGLRFSGLAANLWGEHLVDTDDHASYIDAFTRNCTFCVDLGIGGIRVDTVQPPTIHRTIPYQEGMRRVSSTWQTCCDIAADHGLYVTWEFEPGFAFNKPSDIIRLHDAVDRTNFGLMYDTCHGQMVSVVGARQEGELEIFDSQVDLLGLLRGRINHIHLIDSDNSCHKGDNGEDETSSHPPFGKGLLDFDVLVPLLAKEKLPHDWWTIDLCFWPEAWEATEACKQAIDQLNEMYG